jgi:hypothetical protein
MCFGWRPESFGRSVPIYRSTCLFSASNLVCGLLADPKTLDSNTLSISSRTSSPTEQRFNPLLNSCRLRSFRLIGNVPRSTLRRAQAPRRRPTPESSLREYRLTGSWPQNHESVRLDTIVKDVGPDIGEFRIPCCARRPARALGCARRAYFKDDPATSLIKLRQFAETLAQLVGANAGLFRGTQEPQTDLLRRLKFERVIPDQVGDLFHHLRVVGNKAAHENDGGHAEALTALKMARQLGIWFHRTFGPGKSFVPGAFVPPPDPAEVTRTLAEELARLRVELDQHRTTAENVVPTADPRCLHRSARHLLRPEASCTRPKTSRLFRWPKRLLLY